MATYSLSLADFSFKGWTEGGSLTAVGDGWTTTLSNARAGGVIDKHGAVLRFTTPKDSTAAYYSLKLSIPYVRESKGVPQSDGTKGATAKTGTLYFKLLTSDPPSFMNISNDHDASFDWNVSDLTVHYATPTLYKGLKANTTYYIYIGASTPMQIGYWGSTAGKRFEGTLTYNTIEAPVRPTVTSIVDNGNNTVTITGTGITPNYLNNHKSSYLYVTFDGSYPSEKNYESLITIGAESSFTQNFNMPTKLASKGASTCRALVISDISVFTGYGDDITPQHSDTTYNSLSDNAYKAGTSINYYAAPGDPGVPTISYSKPRLTNTEPWTFKWTAATKANSVSGVKGYRLRLYKNNVNIPIKNDAGTQLSFLNVENDYAYDYETSTASFTLNPKVHDFNAGDTVNFGVYAYTKDRTGARKFNSNHVLLNAPQEVESVGLLQVVNNTNNWVTGIVYVYEKEKESDTTCKWIESSAVYINMDNDWKESQ
jgi:hypothetical protein